MIKILLIIIQYNLVLVEPGPARWADLAYTDQVMYIRLPDTVLSYEVLRVTPTRKDTLVQLSGIGYSGIARFDQKSVYLYLYQNHSKLELYFIKNRYLYNHLKYGRK